MEDGVGVVVGQERAGVVGRVDFGAVVLEEAEGGAGTGVCVVAAAVVLEVGVLRHGFFPLGGCLSGRDVSVAESLDYSILHFYTGLWPQLFI